MKKTSHKSVVKAAPKKKPAVSVKPETAKKKATVKKSTTVTAKKSTAAKEKSSDSKRAVSRRKPSEKNTANKPKQQNKTVTKTTDRTRANKNTKSKAAVTSSRQKKETVVLPTRMSIRAREKALVLADTFEKDFYSAGVTIAKVSGLSFLLIGALVTYTQLSPGADTACAGGTCNVAQVSSALNNAQPVETDQAKDIEFALLADVPTIIERPLGVPIEFSSTVTATAYAEYLADNSNGRIKLPLKEIGNNKYEIFIDPELLPPNQYELKVTAQRIGETSGSSYSLGYFQTVITKDQSNQVITEQNEDKIATTSPDTQISDQTDSVEVKTTASSTEDTVKLNRLNDSFDTQNDTVSVTDSATESIDGEVVENIDTAPPDAAVVDNSLRIETSDVVSGIASVSVENATKEAIVSFRIRPLQTLNTQFLGQLITGTRTFRFDTRQFPDGQYQLFAIMQHGDQAETSNTAQFTIKNITTTKKVDQASSTAAQRQLFDIKNELVMPAVDESAAERTANELTVQQDSASSAIDVLGRARTVLRADADILDDLFQRYAVAVQSGDAALQDEAAKAIQSYRKDRIAGSLLDEQDRQYAQQLNVAIENELNNLTDNVQTFEAIRRERSDIDSVTDTDGDGISDFDEITLYKTDPLQADTDNDGFTDGAEIVSGFNPNDAAIEAAIVYESPKETLAVVKNDVLQVTEVTPEIQLASDNDRDTVQTIVKGRGLPNSFVTLYLFSTPTVVTVRTSADGTFEYTFKQELEDGQHQVYVALTDNTGSIITQSEPFTFVKEAQAFSTVDATETVTALTISDTNNQLSSYRIALGMSVFALGMLLVLLGIGLRSIKPEVVLENKPV